MQRAGSSGTTFPSHTPPLYGAVEVRRCSSCGSIDTSDDDTDDYQDLDKGMPRWMKYAVETPLRRTVCLLLGAFFLLLTCKATFGEAELNAQPKSPAYRLSDGDPPYAVPGVLTRRTVRALIPVADGTNAVEFVGIKDILERGGLSVVVASVTNDLRVQLSKRIEVTADTYIVMEDPADYDVVACPGGVPGAVYFHKSEPLNDFIVGMKAAKKWLAGSSEAACMLFAPNPLVMINITAFTCPRRLWPRVHGRRDPRISDEAIVVDTNMITSQAQGHTPALALKMLDVLVNKSTALEVAAELGLRG